MGEGGGMEGVCVCVCVCMRGWKEGERESVCMRESLSVRMCEFRMTMCPPLLLTQGGAVCV